MKRLAAIAIDYATDPAVGAPRSTRWMIGSAAVFVAAIACNALMDREAQRLGDEIEALRHEQSLRGRSARDSAAGERSVDPILRELAVDWDACLGAIERALVPPLRAVTIEPSLARGRVRLVVEAPNANEVVGLVDRLNDAGSGSGLRNAGLVQHERRETELGPAMRYVVEAEWSPLR